MYVYERMTTEVSKIPFDARVSEAFSIMRENRHSKLPVTDEKGRVMGIISKDAIADILHIASAQVSEYASNHILKKTKVLDVMKQGVLRINKNKLIEEAALFMKENRLEFLPVIDDNELLVGVLTSADILSAFVTVTGIREKGTRIVISANECVKRMGEAISCILSCGEEIIFSSVHKNKSGESSVVIKTANKNTEDVIFSLESKGFNVLQAKNEKG